MMDIQLPDVRFIRKIKKEEKSQALMQSALCRSFLRVLIHVDKLTLLSSGAAVRCRASVEADQPEIKKQEPEQVSLPR